MIGEQYPSCPKHRFAGFKLKDRWGCCVCPKCGDHIGWVAPTDGFLLERPTCSGCEQTGSVHLMRTVQINGNSLVYWHCEACEKFASHPLPHARVLHYLEFLRYRFPERNIPSSIDEIRTRVDNRAQEPCYVCGCTSGTEYHHFMPQVFRHDARVAIHWQQWASCGVRLCRDCHELWHELVAPMALLANANGAAPTEQANIKSEVAG